MLVSFTPYRFRMAAKQTNTRRRKSKITPFHVKECSWCDDEAFDIDDFTVHKCPCDPCCDQIFYLCCLEDECTQRVWDYPSTLERHMERSHQNVKCLKCPKLFKQRSSMMTHLEKSCKRNKNSAKNINKQKRK